MITLFKERDIKQGRLEQRNLQARQQQFDRVRNVFVLKHKIKHTGYQLNDGGIQRAGFLTNFRLLDTTYHVDKLDRAGLRCVNWGQGIKIVSNVSLGLRQLGGVGR